MSKKALALLIVVGFALAALTSMILFRLGVPWWVSSLACFYVGYKTAKLWPVGPGAELRRQELAASVLGAILLGAHTVGHIKLLCGRTYPGVILTLARLEREGDVVSMPRGYEVDGEPVRAWYFTNKNAILRQQGWEP